MATPQNDVAGSIYSGVGTISSSGLYSAPIDGTGVITVRAVTSTGQILYANAELVATNIFTGNQDIGSFSPAGSYSEDDGIYTVNGAGSDIQGTSDQFQFVYLSLTGNGTITARVDSVQNTNAWAKAGVMFRNTLAANSANAFLAMTPGNGATYQYRSSTNGNTSWMNTSGLSAPYWVRLTRSGNDFTAYRSANGVDWTQIGSTATITMNNTVYVGLAVTSHNSGTLSSSIFSHVSVTTPDTTPPTVTINQAEGQADPAIVSPINFTVVFSEPVTDFATGDVTLSGTAGATTAVVTGGGTTYNVAVSGMTSSGTVIASLLAGVAHDAAGNPSLASSSTDNTVTFSLLQLGDYNQDGKVDAADYTVWRNSLGANVAVFSGADGSGNGVVDQADYEVWKANYGTVATGAGGLAFAVASTNDEVSEGLPLVADASTPTASLAEVNIPADSRQLLSSAPMVERVKFSDNGSHAGRRQLPVFASHQDKAILAWLATKGAKPYHDASTTRCDAKLINSTSNDRPTAPIVASLDLAFASLDA